MERSSCHVCGQRRVLGRWLGAPAPGAGPEFRCCACIDEHGDLPGTQAPRFQEGDPPLNWWASTEPPPALCNVPPGHLRVKRIGLKARTCRENLIAVLDPSHHYFTGHGAERVWPAAVLLARHLLARPLTPGLRAVEVGAGCGLPGVVLARRGARVTLTDVPWLVPLAQYNAEANFADDDPRRPDTASLRWGSQGDATKLLTAQGTPDLIIGADVVYREEDFAPLLETLAALGARETLLAVVPRDGVMPSFLRRLSCFPWRVQLQDGGGVGRRRLLLLQLRAPEVPDDDVPAMAAWKPWPAYPRTTGELPEGLCASAGLLAAGRASSACHAAAAACWAARGAAPVA